MGRNIQHLQKVPGRPATVLATLGLLLICGCLASRKAESEKEAERRIASERAKSAEAFKNSLLDKKHQLSIPELDQLTYGYADRYFMVISSAADIIKRGNPDPIQRRLAHQIKLNGVLSMNDIVSGNDPYAQVFDLVVAVTLQSIVLIDENGAEKAFGEHAPGLIKAIRMMRREAWDLAAKVLTQEQLELLDYLILEWRRTHPEVEQVAFIKFENFAGTRSTKLLSDLKAGNGFLAPLSEAANVLKDWGRLTERAFWYSKRAPNVAAIQAEGAVNEILSTPEINSILQTAERLGKTAESAPQLIDAQRSALFAEVDSRQTLLTNTLGDLRHIMSDADSLGRTITLLATNVRQTLTVLGDTLKIADAVGQHFGLDKPSTNPPGRLFDIQEYTAALVRLNEVITNVHQLSLTGDQLSRSEGLRKGLQELTEATDRRVDRVFRQVWLALGLAFLLALLYRVISLQLARRLSLPISAKGLIPLVLIALSGLVSANAATNAPATDLLLDDKTVIELTVELKQYADPPTVAGRVKSVGSGLITVLIHRWASEFAELHPEAEFDIEGGGSVNGMEKLLTGEVDLVPMSRALTENENARFKSKFGHPPAQILVAQDAIGVYVNKNNPIPGLTLTQLDGIYSRESRRGGGRPEFWRDLHVGPPLADERIVRSALVRVHGTYTFFQDEVMQGADYRFDVNFEPVSSSLVQAAGADPATIGFASVMFASASTRFVPIQAGDGAYLLPSYENTVSRRYPLVRPLLIVFNAKPGGSMNPAAREFLRFAVSRRGQRIMALAQGYPLTVEQQGEALRVIGENPVEKTASRAASSTRK